MNKVHKSKKTKDVKQATEAAIHADMRVIEVLTLLPEAGSIFAEYGLHCAGCTLNTVDTLEKGMEAHGYTKEQVDDMVKDLNILLKKRPEKPQTITLTKEGATHLGNIAKNEKREGEYLEVSTDENGGFCLEFRKELPSDALQFVHEDVPDVIVIALPLTLSRIGGATIDFRENRFKLDIDEEQTTCCKGSGDCACKNQAGSAPHECEERIKD